MLLKIFDLITTVQAEIGSGAEVWLSARDGALEIRVDWSEEDYHARRLFDYKELIQIKDDNRVLNFFASWCRNEYKKLAERGKATE